MPVVVLMVAAAMCQVPSLSPATECTAVAAPVQTPNQISPLESMYNMRSYWPPGPELSETPVWLFSRPMSLPPVVDVVLNQMSSLYVIGPGTASAVALVVEMHAVFA